MQHKKRYLHNIIHFFPTLVSPLPLALSQMTTMLLHLQTTIPTQRGKGRPLQLQIARRFLPQR
jgi:hypothetical protein